MNGKTFWKNNNNVLWYSLVNAVDHGWIIKDVDQVDNLGTVSGGIASIGNQGISSCPYNVPNNGWAYYGNDAWIIADANDVSIECMTGNFKF